jgi:serine/threonine protein kinase
LDKLASKLFTYCRDLKPENLLMTSEDDDADIKVVDFGFAIEADGFSIDQQCGTPGYIAPEILENQKYGKPVDMWAFGVILYILLGGYPPFHDNDQKKLFKKILRGAYQFHPEYWTEISSEAKDLIRGLLTLDPHDRLTVDQALNHPWVRATDSKLMAKSLDANLAELKKFQAAKKFKAGIKAVIAMNKLRKLASFNSFSSQDNVAIDIPHTLEARYDLGRVLGEGGYAVVKEGTSKIDRSKVAVKIVNRSKMDKAHEDALRYEVNLMKSLDHKNIVRAFDFFEEKESFFVVMELIKGGELFDRIVKKTCYHEGEAQQLARVLLGAIKYLHDQNVVHRDLKPENLLLLSDDNDSDIKIVDFGFGVRVDGCNLTQHCGTPGYIAPEILRNELYGTRNFIIVHI